MSMKRKEVNKKRVMLKNKAIKRRNRRKAISLLFYTGTLLTCFGLFMSIIAEAHPNTENMKTLSSTLMLLSLGGCISFGKIVLVATKRNS